MIVAYYNRTTGRWIGESQGVDGLGDDDCLKAANAHVASLDARILELVKHWNPTGLYKGDELLRMITENFKAMTAAADLVRAAPRSTGDAEVVINQAVALIQGKFRDADRFVKAAQAAQVSGALVSAPDFKQWVVSSMQAQSSAIVAATVLDCNMSWLAKAIIAYMGVFSPAWDFIVSVVGQILKVGETIINVPRDTAVALGKLVTLSMIAGGAYLAYQLFFKPSPRSYRSRSARA